MSHRVNCKSDYVFQVDISTPAAATGVDGPPAPGALTGVRLRLSATRTGAAVHGNVGAMAASERSGMPGRFYVEVDAALLTNHVLPLGVGKPFWGVWSRTGDFDMESVPYQVADGTIVA